MLSSVGSILLGDGSRVTRDFTVMILPTAIRNVWGVIVYGKTKYKTDQTVVVNDDSSRE